MLPAKWRLLIYTVPSQPSRKRAFIWRELKKVGAAYLRDGVCALPESRESAAALGAVARKIDEFGGEAIVIPGTRLDSGPARRIASASLAERHAEYDELRQEAELMLAHIEHETEHRNFTLAELAELEADLHKLRRWFEQIQARDYFDDSGGGGARDALLRCERALGQVTTRPRSARRRSVGVPK